MEWFVDSDRGRWLQEGIPELGYMVPSGMAAYVKLFHPIDAFRFDSYGRVDAQERWNWAEVAARNGVRLGGDSEWSSLLPGVPARYSSVARWSDGWEAQMPDTGWVDPAYLASLVATLRSHTTTPERITLAVWEGSGFAQRTPHASADSWVESLNGARVEPTDPRFLALSDVQEHAFFRTTVADDLPEFELPLFDLPGRRYILGVTALDHLADPAWPYESGLGWCGRSVGPMPQLMWPDDQAWCVSLEVDAPYTVIAGSEALISELLERDDLESSRMDEPDDY